MLRHTNKDLRMLKEMRMYGEVQRILYDPVSWIHQERFPAIAHFSSTRCQSVMNDIILEKFKLSTECIDLNSSLERYIIMHWELLPGAALMAACQRYRANLARNGFIVKLDKTTQQFAMACLVDSESQVNQTLSKEALVPLACQEAIAFSQTLSQSIRERVPLLFARSPVALDTEVYNSNDELLLRMAIQHAKRSQ